MSHPLGTRDDWAHPGVRALLLLHERELQRLLETWRRAVAAGVQVPPTDDEDVASLDALLEHAVAHPMRHTLQLESWLKGA